MNQNLYVKNARNHKSTRINKKKFQCKTQEPL